MLTFYIDFKSPAAYLAMAPTRRLVDEYGVELHCKPFISREREKPTSIENETVGDRHRRVRAQSRRAIHEHYARLHQLEMHWPESPGSADFALGALALLENDPWPFMERAFRAYWIENRNLDSQEVVESLLDDSNWSLASTEPDVLRMALSAEQEAAEALGVVDAPAYWIEEQLFVGREHLPWIRELLA